MARAASAPGLCVAIAASLAARAAAAGDYVHHEIVAATEDGAYLAEYDVSDGNLEPGTCGLRKVGANELLVHADCVQADTTRPVLPLAKWRWIDPTPEAPPEGIRCHAARQAGANRRRRRSDARVLRGVPRRALDPRAHRWRRARLQGGPQGP